jgi:hypothetical protein
MLSEAAPRTGKTGIETASALALGAANREMALAQKRRAERTEQLKRITSPLAAA